MPCEDQGLSTRQTLKPLLILNRFPRSSFRNGKYHYSSLAYKIEAVRLLGKVLSTSANKGAATEGHVERLDTSLAKFLLSLAPDKRWLVERDGKVDQFLFSAHKLTDSALILLHRARSTLIIVQNHYPTPCTRQEAILGPTTAHEIHSAKAVKAADSITTATALRTPLANHTPCFTCATLPASIVYLPESAMESDCDRSAP